MLDLWARGAVFKPLEAHLNHTKILAYVGVPRRATLLVHHNIVQTNQMHLKLVNRRMPSVSMSFGGTLHSHPADSTIQSTQSNAQSTDLLKFYLFGKTIKMRYLEHMV